MLNGGTLDGATLSVTSDLPLDDPAHDDAHPEGTPFDQSDKPRAGSQCYSARRTSNDESSIIDFLQLLLNISQRAMSCLIACCSGLSKLIVSSIERLVSLWCMTDHLSMVDKQGISKRFLSYFHSVDTALGARALGPEQTISGKVTSTVGAATQTATQQAKSLDEQRGISKTANDYYTKYLSTPIGQKIRDFYTTTAKQVQDIHEEAQRLAAETKAKETHATEGAPTGATAPATAPAAANPATSAQPTTQAAPTVI
ncbi:hypothetical protein HGRIS_005893 [Hohenbuehelia grisea]